MGEVGNIFITLGMKFDEVEKAMSAIDKATVKIGDKLQDIGKKVSIAGAAITVAFGAIILKTTALGDQFDDLRQRTGISTETLSSFSLAVNKTDMGITGFATALKFLANNMADAAAKGGEAKAKFDTLGVSFQNLDGTLRPLDQVMLDVADTFKAMPDGAQKSALAVDLFGRAGTAMIHMLNLGRAGLQAEIDKAKEFGIVFSTDAAGASDKFQESLVDLKGALQGIGMTITAAVLPVIQGFIKSITGVIVKIREWADAHPGLIKAFGTVVLAIGGILSVFGPLIIGLATVLKNIVPLKAALLLLKGGFATLISPVGLATAGIITLFLALTPGDTILERVTNLLWVMTNTIKGWIQAIKEANEVIGGSWMTKPFKMEMNERMAEAKTKAVEFAASLKVLKPTMDAIQQTMEQGPKVWNEWSTSVKATDAILAANKDTILGWIDKGLIWLGLTKDMSVGANALAAVFKDFGLKTKTELTEESGKAEAALRLLKGSVEATPGAITALEDKITSLKESLYGTRTETETLTETFTPMARGAEFVRDVMQGFSGILTDTFIPAARDMSLVMAAAPGVFSEVANAAAGIDSVFKAIGDSIGVSAETVKVAMWNMAADVLAAYGIIIAKIPELATTTEEVTKKMKDYFAGLFNDIATGFGNTIQQSLTDAWGFSHFMKEIWNDIKDAFFRVIGEMIANWTVNFVKKIIDSTVDIGASIAKNVAGPISSIAGAAGQAASGFLSALGSVGSIIAGIVSLIELLKGPQKQTDVTYWLKLQWELLQNSYNFYIGKLTWMLETIANAVNGSMKPALWKISTATQLSKDHLKSCSDSLKASVGYLKTIAATIGKLTGTTAPAATFVTSTMGYNSQNQSASRFASGGIAWTPQLARIAERGPEVIMPLRGYRSDAMPSTGGGNRPVNLTFQIRALDGADVESVVKRRIVPILQTVFDHNGLRVPTGAVGG